MGPALMREQGGGMGSCKGPFLLPLHGLHKGQVHRQLLSVCVHVLEVSRKEVWPGPPFTSLGDGLALQPPV